METRESGAGAGTMENILQKNGENLFVSFFFEGFISPGRHFALKRAVDLNYYGSIVKNIDSTILQGLIVQIPISTPIIIWIPIKSQLQNYC